MARRTQRKNPGLFVARYGWSRADLLPGQDGSGTAGVGNAYGYGLFATPSTPQSPEDVAGGLVPATVVDGGPVQLVAGLAGSGYGAALANQARRAALKAGR